MAADFTTTPAVNDATKLDDYTRLRDTARALAASMGGVVLCQGGSLEIFLTDTTAVPVPLSGGTAGFEADGTYLGYVTVVLEVVAIRQVASTVTCTVDLYDATTGAAIASSSVAISLTTANATHQKSSALTLPTGVKRYYARIKTNDGTLPVAAEWRLVAKGA